VLALEKDVIAVGDASADTCMEERLQAFRFHKGDEKNTFRPVCLSVSPHEGSAAQSRASQVTLTTGIRKGHGTWPNSHVRFSPGGEAKTQTAPRAEGEVHGEPGHGMSGESGIALIAFQASLWGSIRDLDLRLIVRGEALRD
jgi:hypothetical protein